MPEGKLYIISGPSGSGKSTITREVIARTRASLSVSATTRPRSDQEVDGVDYYFIDKQEFETRIARGEFLEYAQVFDNYYGTPLKPVQDQIEAGQTVILEIDVQGGLQVFAKKPDAHGVLILPPDMEELKRRLVARQRDNENVIEKRLKKAEWEISAAQNSGHYDFVIINDNLEQAIERVVAIIQPS